MAELYLVRHGQAAFGTDNYDRLSPLGERQSRWLGEYFAERDLVFDRVYSGTLNRQRATVDAIVGGLGVRLAGEMLPELNEYDFAMLAQAYRGLSGARPPPPPGDHAAFYRLLKRALQAWAGNEIGTGLPETWQAFRDRTAAAVAKVRRSATKGERVLVVSSGGPIAAILGNVLALTDAQAIELNMQIYNTSVSRVYFNPQRIVLAAFNAVPHLDTPGRLDAITYG